MLAMTVWAASDSLGTVEQSRLARIENAVSKVLSKAGINFSGEFRSQFLLSRVDGDGVRKSFRKDEGVEFTSVDFDISARPNSAVSGRLIFRLHQDWRNLWSSYKNPISSRWISVNGLVKSVFSYNVGDFRQKYSPLTLYSPDIEIPYEPEIFARQRKMAMDEVFLGDNDRLMQGVNMNFDAEIVPVFREFHLNVLGSRLKMVTDNEPGQKKVILDSTLMDKYCFGTNLSMGFIPQLSVGGSFLTIFDNRYSYGADLELADTIAQRTMVYAGRAGFGTAPWIDPKAFNILLSAEFALSSDDTSWLKVDTISPTQYVLNLHSKKINGIVVSADLKSTLKLGSSGAMRFDLGFLSNAPDFRNELAQSPTFFAFRIMNSENDPGTGALYSTFDALYRHVFEFCVSENAAKEGNLMGWLKGPMSKNAYGTGILTQREIRKVQPDNALSLVMPFGPATPNRIGAKAGLSADFLDKAIHVSGAFKYLSEQEPLSARLDNTTTLYELPKTAFLEAGGGLSVNVAALGKWWPHPLILSGGYTLSRASNDGITQFAGSPWETTVHFINGGLYWTFWRKASLLGGLQYVTTGIDGILDNVVRDLAQLHWAAGLEYKVSDGGTLTGSFGFTDVTHTDETNPNASTADFRQWQTDLYLTVRF